MTSDRTSYVLTFEKGSSNMTREVHQRQMKQWVESSNRESEFSEMN